MDARIGRIVSLLLALVSIFLAQTTANPLDSARCEELQLLYEIDYISAKVPERERTRAISLLHHAPPPTTHPTPGSISRRALLPSVTNITYRLLQLYFIEPMRTGTSNMQADMNNDLDAAFSSYLRAVEALRDDYPPLFRFAFSYGALQLHFDCPHPLNKQNVRDALTLVMFVVQIFGAALLRLQIWSAVMAGLVVTFGVLPRLPGSQHAVFG